MSNVMCLLFILVGAIAVAWMLSVATADLSKTTASRWNTTVAAANQYEKGSKDDGQIRRARKRHRSGRWSWQSLR